MQGSTDIEREELRRDVKALCKKWANTYGLLIIVEENDGDGQFTILGSLCPPCAHTKLGQFITEHNIPHFGSDMEAALEKLRETGASAESLDEKKRKPS